jgi:thiol-disulfide isomerase/thioredoxin
LKHVTTLLTALLLVACGGEPESMGEPSLRELRGDFVVINYWAPWCKPCIEEIPELNELDARHDNVSVLGVNFDGATGQELAQQEERLGVAFPTLTADPSAELGIPRPVVLPTTIIVGPDGEVFDKLVGPQTLASLEQAIAAYEPP